MALEDDVRQLWSDDPGRRSEAVRAIVAAAPKRYSREVIQGLVQALDHNDYEIQEWATVALRRCRGSTAVAAALWECFRTEARHSARSCALIALGHLGQCLAPDGLLALYDQRKAHSKDLILESGIRWAGQNDGSPQMLTALQEIQKREFSRERREPRLQATLATALLRAARLGLVNKQITKDWLKQNGYTDVLDKLRETRIERMRADEDARKAQPMLAPEFEPRRDQEPLVPGFPLSDAVERQYVQDLSDFANVRIREQRSFVRDRTLAEDAKRKADYCCQRCGDRLDDPVQARRYVQAHHIEPLSELGADIAENVAVLCPNCHAKMHAGAIRAERTQEGFVIVHDTSLATRADAAPPANVAGTSMTAPQQVVALFQQLQREEQIAVIRELLAIAASDRNPEGIDG